MGVGLDGPARSMVWRDADVKDYLRFPSRAIKAGPPLPLRREPRDVDSLAAVVTPGGDLRAFLARTKTAAFVVFSGNNVIYDASWSLDSKTDGFEKMESGLNGRAVDLARLGLLYLHGGAMNGKQIVPRNWVNESTAFSNASDPSTRYQYQW